MTIHRFWNKECERLSEQNCPCILAEVNACPVCDHLKGYDLILFGMKDNICNDIGILREEIKQSSLVSMLYLYKNYR